MSVVWRAYDEVLGRQVAVKVLAAKFASDKDSRDRIRAEAQAAARLSHPHVTGVFDYGESTGEDGATVPYVVMELISGRTLAQRLARGPMPWRAALRVSAEVAAALSAAHARGLVHRDVKPANVMLTASGAKVVDFGIAAIAGDTGDNDPEGMVLGTPAYLAPERLAGGPVRPATDVYALGLLLYRSLTGGLPWRAETTTQMIKAHVYHEPTPLPAVDGLPDGVADLCLRCLAKDPEERPTSREVARTLAGAAGIRVPLNASEGEPEDLVLDPAPFDTDPQLPLAGRPAGRLRKAVMALFGPDVDPNADTSMLPNSVIDSASIRNARRRRRRRIIQVSTGAAVLAVTGLVVSTCGDFTGNGQTVANAAGNQAGSSKAPCSVRYETKADSAGQFNVDVTVINNQSEPVRGWTVQFAFSGDQTLRMGFSGEWSQSQTGVVTARGGGPRSVLEPRASSTIGFTADYRIANPMPTVFTLNGTPCSYVLVGASGETHSGGPVQPSSSAYPVDGQLPGMPIGGPIGGDLGGDPGGNNGGSTGGGTQPGSGATVPGTAPPPTVKPTKPPKTPKPKPPKTAKPSRSRHKPCLPVVCS
jgi:serine/threonine-protein kinase